MARMADSTISHSSAQPESSIRSSPSNKPPPQAVAVFRLLFCLCFPARDSVQEGHDWLSIKGLSLLGYCAGRVNHRPSGWRRTTVVLARSTQHAALLMVVEQVVARKQQPLGRKLQNAAFATEWRVVQEDPALLFWRIAPIERVIRGKGMAVVLASAVRTE